MAKIMTAAYRAILVAIFIQLFPALLLAEQISVAGFTEPYLDSTLGVSVTGQVVKIHVKEGDKVNKGQVLLELDQAAEKLEVRRRQLLVDSRAEIAAVSRQLETLAAHLQATRELYETTGSVPREDLENQQLEHALAEVELLRLEQTKKREEIELDIARKQLKKRTLQAPFSGEIAEIIVSAGENCELDTKLVRLVNTSQGYFVANIEMTVSQQLSLGQDVELQFSTGLQPITMTGQIAFISPVIDPASGLRKVKARFNNPDGQLVPGMAGIMLFTSGNN